MSDYSYPPYGCSTWLTPTVLSESYAEKIKLIAEIKEIKVEVGGTMVIKKIKQYRIEGLPCWTNGYSGWLPEHSVDYMLEVGTDGCWHGVCQELSILFTVLLQGQAQEYNNMDGKSIKAMSVIIIEHGHAIIEIYIKGEGYYWMDNSHVNPYLIIPQSGLIYHPETSRMSNVNVYDDPSNGIWGYVPYSSTWAGPRIYPPDVDGTTKEVTIASVPLGANINIKKK